VRVRRRFTFGDTADDAIFAYAKTQGLVLVSRDLDFSDGRRYPPADTAGIVIVRLADDAVAQRIAELFGRFLRTPLVVDQLAGRIAVVTEDRIRLRPPLA
jgi:predicted nuclease of predicted toxin-antitoxin system